MEADLRAIARLEEMLDDTEVCPGWWSVRLEALSMLANPAGKYRDLEAQEKGRIMSDPNASDDDRRWADPI